MKRILKSAAVLALASALALSASATLAITEAAPVENSAVTVKGAGKVAFSLPTEIVADDPAAATVVDAALPADMSAAQAYFAAHANKYVLVNAAVEKSEKFTVVVDAAAAADAAADTAALLAQAGGDAAADAAALLAQAADAAAALDLTAIDPALLAQAGAALDAAVADAPAAADAFDLTTAKLTVAKDDTASVTAKLDGKVNNLLIVAGELKGNFDISTEEASVVKVIKDPNAKVTLVNIAFGRATDKVTLKLTAKSDVTFSDVIIATEPGDNTYSAGAILAMTYNAAYLADKGIESDNEGGYIINSDILTPWKDAAGYDDMTEAQQSAFNAAIQNYINVNTWMTRPFTVMYTPAN